MGLTPVQLKHFAVGQVQWVNRVAWLNGIYFRAALMEVFSALTGRKGSTGFKYPNQPYQQLQTVTEQDKQKQEEAELVRAKLYMSNMVRAGRSWGK